MAIDGVAAAVDEMPLDAADQAILALECETVVGHTCKLITLAPSGIGVDDIRAIVASRLAQAPVLTRRLGGTEQAPQWVVDEAFDIERHIVAAPVARPVDDAGLRELVAALFAQHLDRSRPLWRMDVAALRDGGTALIWRLHHALADGTTTMRWARALLWDQPDEVRPAAVPAARADDTRRRWHLAGLVQREFGRSPSRSPFDGTIGTAREIGLAALPLPALKRAAHEAAGATVNDALLTIVAGAVRRYLETHHGSLGDIRVRVPVSLHNEQDTTANRDSYFSFRLPLHISDPLERLHVVRAATILRKRAHDAEHEDEVLRELAGLAPLQRFVERLNDSPRRFAVSVSNVPGPRGPVSVSGRQVTSLAGIAEIGFRHALRVAGVSLADQLSVSFCADPALVPAVHSMAQAAEADAHALLAAVP